MENDLWASLKQNLEPYGRLKRIENSCDKGTPDISYLLRRYAKVDPIAGWLEMKWAPGWPYDGSPLRVKSLTKDQVLWQEDWAAGGGRVFTLIRVHRDHLLVKPCLLRRVYERTIDPITLRGLATISWEGAYDPIQLLRALT